MGQQQCAVQHELWTVTWHGTWVSVRVNGMTNKPSFSTAQSVSCNAVTARCNETTAMYGATTAWTVTWHGTWGSVWVNGTGINRNNNQREGSWNIQQELKQRGFAMQQQ